MMKNSKLTGAVLAVFFFLCCNVVAYGQAGSAEVEVNSDGSYTVTSSSPQWQFSGSVGHPVSDLNTANGNDSKGAFTETSFRWQADGQSYEGRIRWYKQSPVVLFSLETPNGASKINTSFPEFTTFPKNMHTYSFRDEVFSPPVFGKLTQTSTPWLFFNDQAQSFILSPASDFIVSKMTGDGEKSIASGLNPGLTNLPEGFTHHSVLVLGDGIGKTWTRWGDVMRARFNRKVSANDADPILKYYGYWTDNGADYYYNYDKELGYANTLLALRKHYDENNIPMGYMQLDSWWYEKSIYTWDGKPEADHKNKNLPKGKWNRYGGLMEYRPDPFLFPGGMAAFQEKLDVPLAVHNRWIDPRSPYHDKYDVTGYAATDPDFWNDIANYLKKSGIVYYEQDWLNHIYGQTPRMATDLSVGNAYTDGMAHAFAQNDMDMQYCMATPRFFMQGVKYDNLTSIRTSLDRFQKGHWRPFIYTSQLGYAIGMWPWTDVFKSSETGNMIISVLSAGVVGTGDAIGKEDKSNIMKASRTDGVLIKPDVPLLPLDSNYINEAKHANKPMLAYTYTRHQNLKTDYLFAFKPNEKTSNQFSFSPADLGQQGDVIIYNRMDDSAEKLSASEKFSGAIGKDDYAFYEVAPVTSTGIAFLGDANKIASTGKKRISTLSETANGLQVTVQFASGEGSVTLHGYYEHPFKTDVGELALHPETNMFDLVVNNAGDKEAEINLTTDK